MGISNQPFADAQQVRLAPGISAKSPQRLAVRDVDDFPHDLELIVDLIPMDDDKLGHLECRELRIKQRAGGAPVTSRSVQAVPIATLLRGLAARIHMVDNAGDGALTSTQNRLTDDDVQRLREAGPTTETLTEVARAYRLALVAGNPPAKDVQRTFEIPRSTAGRWISAARKRGFLGPSEGQGRAGA